MLGTLRNQIAKWAVALLVLLIVGTFALWGIGDYLQDSGNPVVATFGSQEITVDEFRAALQRDEATYRRMLGADYDPAMFEDAAIRRLQLQRLIDERLLVADALSQGFVVPDDALAQTITSIELFQTNGHFDQDRYLALIRQQGNTPQSFERQLRQTMITDQIRSSLSSSAVVTPQELEQINQIQGETRDARFVRLSPRSFANLEEPSTSDIEAYYEAHIDEFKTSEMVIVDYVVVRRDELAANIEVTQDNLQQLYAERLLELTQPERRQIRHIMISLDPDANEDAETEAREKLLAVRSRLQEGAAFAELAATVSEDPASANRGGDLGEVVRGDLDPQLEAAAFSLPLNTVSEPVRSGFGLHLLEVTAITGEHKPDIDEIRDQLLQEQRENAAQEIFFEQAELLQTVSYEQPDSLAAAAEAVGQPIQTSEPFSRVGGMGLLGHPDVTAQAFSDEVLISGYNSDLVTPQDGVALVLRRREHIPPQPIPLDEVTDTIRERLTEQSMIRQAREIGIALDNALAAGNTEEVDRLMAEHDLSWQQRTGISRTAPGETVTPELARAIFQAPVTGADGTPSYQTVDLADGSYVIFTVTGASQNADKLSQADAAQLREEMQRIRAAAAFEAYIDDLRANADIRIFSEAL